MPSVRPFFLFLTVLLMLAVAWGAVYLNNRGFTATVRQQVAQRFREMGVELRMDRLTMEPERGVVARGVRIFESEAAKKDKDLPVARFNEVALDVDFVSMVKGDFDVTRVTLNDAALYLPVKYKNAANREEQRFLLNQVNARLNFQGENLVMQATGRLRDIQWQLAGSIAKPRGEPLLWQRFQTFLADLSPLTEKEKSRTSFYRAKMNALWLFLRDCNFDPASAPPRLKLEIYGNLDDPRQLSVALDLSCGRLVFDSHAYERVEARLLLEEGVVKLERCLLWDADGQTSMTARLPLDKDAATAEWTMESNSRMAWRWMQKAVPTVSQWSLDLPCAVQLQGTWTAGAKPGEPAREFNGNFTVGPFRMVEYKGDKWSDSFTGSAGQISFNGHDLYLRHWHAAHATGQLKGRVLRRGAEVLTEVEDTMDPLVSRRLLDIFGKPPVPEAEPSEEGEGEEESEAADPS